MFDSDNWIEIWHSMKKNPLRSFMTGFGVFWGMFMLIIMLGSGNGLRNGVTGDMKGFSTNSVYVWAMSTSKAYAGFKPGRRVQLTFEDAAAIKNNVKHVDIIAPRNQLGGYGDNNNISRGTKSGSFTVMGDTPDYFKVKLLELSYGRVINEFDMRDKRKVCVIGDRVHEVLFNRGENPIGKSISIQGAHFTVIGMTKSGNGRMSRRDGESIYIPFSTFTKAYNYGNKVSWFSILANKTVPPESVEANVKSYLAERHKVDPEDSMAFGSFTAGKFMKKMNQGFSLINLVVWIVGIFSLISGIIGISNIMIVVVKERTKEIGVKRALGARPYLIIRQVIMEAFSLTAIFGYAGLVLGVVLLENASTIMSAFDVSDQYFKNPEIDFNIAVQSLVVLIFCGMVAGLIPAIRAARIKPIEALREE